MFGSSVYQLGAAANRMEKAEPKNRRYRVSGHQIGQPGKLSIQVHDNTTGFKLVRRAVDFYDGTVRGGGCEYCAKLPGYVFEEVGKIEAGHNAQLKVFQRNHDSLIGDWERVLANEGDLFELAKAGLVNHKRCADALETVLARWWNGIRRDGRLSSHPIGVDGRLETLAKHAPYFKRYAVKYLGYRFLGQPHPRTGAKLPDAS